NNPPSLYEPCEWTDLNGNFWLFGGRFPSTDNYADLWKYNPLTNQWTWIKGPNAINFAGNYGIQGVPSALNNPPSKSYGVTSWADNQGNLWMYGGLRYSPNSGMTSDLWKYEISTNEWTWMKGFDTINQPAIYGIQGVSDPANNPQARYEC